MSDKRSDGADLHSGTSSPVSFSRRGLLRAGVGVGGVALLGVGGAARSVVGDQAAADGRQMLSEPEARFLTALADALFPPGNALGVAGKDVDVAGQVDVWVAAMPATERRIVASLLHLFDVWPRLSLASFSRFSELDLEKRINMLIAFDTSSVETRRALGQLLRALVSVVFFEDERVQAGMGLAWGCEVPM